jgi:hypothetical protein
VTRAKGREALSAILELIAARSVHPLGLVVLTEPSGQRCMELRRWVDGRPILLRAPFSPLVLAGCLAEDVEVEYRACVRLPKDGAP